MAVQISLTACEHSAHVECQIFFYLFFSRSASDSQLCDYALYKSTIDIDRSLPCRSWWWRYVLNRRVWSYLRAFVRQWRLESYRRQKILESACMNFWSPRAQRVDFALFGAHSRKHLTGLWSENIVTSVAKTRFLNFLKWVKRALILIFVTRMYTLTTASNSDTVKIV